MPGVARIVGGQSSRNATAGGNVFAPIGVVTKPVERAILPTATPHQAIPRSVENRPLASTACKGDFADRPLPLNILGGYRWPDSVAVDRKVLANIIRAEIGEAVLTEGERS
jgi:hypothetical protein